MPFFELKSDHISFPPGHFADVEGLLAEGGEVTAKWLIAAFKSGSYLWSSPIEPLRWWNPDPRIVLFTHELQIPEILKTLDIRSRYTIKYNQKLNELLEFCATSYNTGPMTAKWMTGMHVNAYETLNNKGIISNLILYENDEIVAGVFGISMGQVFFGEYVCGNSEELAALSLVLLVQKLTKKGINIIDLHKETMETIDIGYREISRNEFLSFL